MLGAGVSPHIERPRSVRGGSAFRGARGRRSERVESNRPRDVREGFTVRDFPRASARRISPYRLRIFEAATFLSRVRGSGGAYDRGVLPVFADWLNAKFSAKRAVTSDLR